MKNTNTPPLSQKRRISLTPANPTFSPGNNSSALRPLSEMPVTNSPSDKATSKRRFSGIDKQYTSQFDPPPEKLFYRYFKTIADASISNNMVIVLRDINKDASSLISKGFFGKTKETKGKSTNEGPIAGCISLNVCLSKATKNLVELQKKNDEVVQTSIQQLEDFKERYKGIINIKNENDHKNFVEKFNSAQIIIPIHKEIEINEGGTIKKYPLYYKTNIFGQIKTEKIGIKEKPIYIIEKTEKSGEKKEYQYNYNTGMYDEIPTNTNEINKPVEILNYATIQLDEKTKKVEEEGEKSFKRYLHGITADIDILTLGFGIDYKDIKTEKTGNVRLTMSGESLEKLEKFVLKPINKPKIEEDSIIPLITEIISYKEKEIVKDNTEALDQKDRGMVTDKEWATITYLYEETQGAINHGTEANHLIFPEEFKNNEEYIAILPHNSELITKLKNKFGEKRIKTCQVPKDFKPLSSTEKIPSKIEDNYIKINYLVLGEKKIGEKEKSSIDIQEELCSLTNIARSLGYPMPINPQWGWTKDFLLPDNFNNEDLKKFIKSELNIGIPKPPKAEIINSASLLISPSINKVLDNGPLDSSSIKLVEEEIQKNVNQDSVWSIDHLLTLTKNFIEEAIGKLIPVTPNKTIKPTPISNSKSESQDTIKNNNGDGEFWSDINKDIKELQKKYIKLLGEESFYIEAGEEKKEKEKLIEDILKEIKMGQELLDIRMQITKLLMEPPVYYQNIQEEAKQITEIKIEEELESRIEKITTLCKSFWNYTKNREYFILKNTKRSRDSISKIINSQTIQPDIPYPTLEKTQNIK